MQQSRLNSHGYDHLGWTGYVLSSQKNGFPRSPNVKDDLPSVHFAQSRRLGICNGMDEVTFDVTGVILSENAQ